MIFSQQETCFFQVFYLYRLCHDAILNFLFSYFSDLFPWLWIKSRKIANANKIYNKNQ